MLGTLRLSREPTPERSSRGGLVVLTAFAGLVSGLITVGLVYPIGQLSIRHHQLAMYLLGAPFGAVLAAYLASYKLLRGLGGSWRAIFLVTVSMGTYFVSFILAALVEFAVHAGRFHTQTGSISPISLFPGGFVGGFVILGTVTLLVYPTTNFASLRQRIFFAAILSGALGVIGWALGPYFGIHLWSALHALGCTPPDETFQNALLGDRSRWLSLFVVWQTGTAFLLGFILRRR